ncbi:hypothetical protein GCM10027022_20860 [Alpinimonas psychrophila]|uniref:Signal transduction histidine kinase n=1 Tax=Alpinimonas psychrophila TaxID=748908 RepID=A0A7W3JV66_9MICO|nr:ATP-binding protein [Alpinimonas psychrophila]MBA8829745.1 signal transduction histidine kinase [Alpinimonas psychrophila]
MALGIPAKFAPLLLSRALSRQLLVYAICLLVTAQVALIAMGIYAGQFVVVAAAGVFFIPLLVLMGMMFWFPYPWVAAIYLATAGTALYIATSAVLTLVPNATTTALAPFALVSIAMTLVTSAAATVPGRVVLAIVGSGLSTLVLVAAATTAQSEFRWDARAVIGALVIIGIAFIVPGQVTLASKAQAAFDASLAEAQEDGARANVNREAIARVHDTLLADLTVVARIKPGPLSPEVRAMLERELAHLVSTDWFVAAIDQSEKTAENARQPSFAAEMFLAAIDSSAVQGLDINMSGDIAALDPLSAEAALALTGAVGQCLSNVVAHAHMTRVDVVVLPSGDGVTVTVIDGGVGFEPDAVAVDRLGLRFSVRSRIESAGGFVTIWSTPGHGTAIMLQVPYGANP